MDRFLARGDRGGEQREGGCAQQQQQRLPAMMEQQGRVVRFCVALRGRSHHRAGKPLEGGLRIQPNQANAADRNALLVTDSAGVVCGYVDKEAAAFVSPLLRAGFFRDLELTVMGAFLLSASSSSSLANVDVPCVLALHLEPDKVSDFHSAKVWDGLASNPKPGIPPLAAASGFQKASKLYRAPPATASVAAATSSSTDPSPCESEELFMAHKRLREAMTRTRVEDSDFARKLLPLPSSSSLGEEARLKATSNKFKKQKRGTTVTTPSITHFFSKHAASSAHNAAVAVVDTSTHLMGIKWETWLDLPDLLCGLRLTCRGMRQHLDATLPRDFVRFRKAHALRGALEGGELLSLCATHRLPNLLCASSASHRREMVQSIARDTSRPAWRNTELLYAFLCYLLLLSAAPDLDVDNNQDPQDHRPIHTRRSRNGCALAFHALHDELLHMVVGVRAPSSSGTLLTPQQSRVLRADFSPGALIKVSALAGSGKTTLLRELARSRADKRFLYLCFNKSVQLEASAKFPANVDCRTIHSLCFERTGFKPFACSQADDFDSVARWMALARSSSSAHLEGDDNENEADDGGEFASSRRISVLVGRLNHFLNSPEPTSPHNSVNALWKAMQDGFVSMTYAGVLKTCALKRVELREYDVVMLDEAQDCNPAALQVVLAQTHCARVIVGDANQAIYGFANSTNAMKESTPTTTTTNNMGGSVPTQHFSLTRSFRFGPQIAVAVTAFLRAVKRPCSFVFGAATGRHASSTLGRATPGETPAMFCRRVQQQCNGSGGTTCCFLSRTNVACLEAAVGALREDPRIKIGFVGGLKSARVDDLRDVVQVMTRSRVGPGGNQASEGFALLARCESLDAFYAACVTRGLQEWVSIIHAVKRWGEETALHIVETLCGRPKSGGSSHAFASRVCSKLEDADLVFSTVHRSKGLEYDGVYVGDDFDLGSSNSARFDALDEETQNLLYVAFTRAKRALVLNDRIEHSRKLWERVVTWVPNCVDVAKGDVGKRKSNGGVCAVCGGGCVGPTAGNGNRTWRVSRVWSEQDADGGGVCGTCAQRLDERLSSTMYV